jgi:hypothetical protein
MKAITADANAQERSKHASKYLEHVLSFERDRHNMDEIWRQHSSAGLLQAEVAVEIPQDRMRQPAQTLGKLFDAAEAAHPVFAQVLVEIAEELSLPVVIATNTDDQKVHKDAPVQCELYVDILKSRARAQQKADTDYEGDVARLLDIVRATFVCQADQQIVDVLRSMRARHSSVDILRLKNRFVNPTPSGFRDLLLNIGVSIKTATGNRIFICEVQIHHAAMLRYDRENGFHSHYEFFREYFKGSSESVQNRIELVSSMGRYDPHVDLDTIVTDIISGTNIGRLNAFKDLAELLGELEAAVIVQKRILEFFRECSTEKEDADIATALNDLSMLLKKQGECDEAELLYQQSLEMRRKVSTFSVPAVVSQHFIPALLRRTHGSQQPSCVVEDTGKVQRGRSPVSEISSNRPQGKHAHVHLLVSQHFLSDLRQRTF